MFQDRGQLFSLQDGHPNIYAPGKRPFQTIIPGFAAKDGKPWLSFGVMGGDMQPQGQTQIILNRVDYGLDVQAAADSPRWHHEGSSQSMGEDRADASGPIGLLRLEAGIPVATRKALVDLGWKMGPSDGGFGRYECIEVRMQGGRSRVRGGQRDALRRGGAGLLALQSQIVMPEGAGGFIPLKNRPNFGPLGTDYETCPSAPHSQSHFSLTLLTAH